MIRLSDYPSYIKLASLFLLNSIKSTILNARISVLFHVTLVAVLKNDLNCSVKHEYQFDIETVHNI